MSYIVTYETEAYPYNAPEGAKITKAPFKTVTVTNVISDKSISVDKGLMACSKVTLKTNPLTGAVMTLNADQSRKIANALLDLAQEDKPLPGHPERDMRRFEKGDLQPGMSIQCVVDRDGDKWYRKGTGEYAWTASEGDTEGVSRWRDILDYAPLTEVDLVTDPRRAARA